MQPEFVSSVWPLSGFALSLLILSPKYRWRKLLTVFFAVNFLTHLSIGLPLLFCFLHSVISITESYLCASLFFYLSKGKKQIETERDVIALFLSAFLVTTITGLFASYTAVYVFHSPFIQSWYTWVASNGVGVILITPLIVSIFSVKKKKQQISFWGTMEVLLLFFVLISLSVLLFSPLTVAESPFLRSYVFFPILIILALRFTLKSMEVALFLTSVIALIGTIQSFGLFSFVNQAKTANLISTQIFITVITFSSLILSAVTNKLKSQEKELRESRETIDDILDHTKVQMWAFDGTYYIYTNKEWFNYTGQNPKDILTVERWLSAVHPDDREPSYLVWKKNWEAKTEHDNYFRLKRHDGEYHYFYCHALPIYELDGKFKYFQGVNLDINELRKTEEELKESQELLSLFIQNSPIYTYVKSVTPSENRVLYASRNFGEMIGGGPNLDITGKTTEELFPDEFAKKITNDDRQVISCGKILQIDEDFNGRNYSTIKYPIHFKGKDLLAGYSIDVTKLKELDRLKDEFLSTTMHELKSPLLPIKSQSQLLLSGEYGELNLEQKDAVKMILRNEEALSVLANDIFDIAKIKSGKLNLVLSSTNIGKVVTDALYDRKKQADNKHISFSFLVSREIPEIKVDEMRIHQAVVNLLNNAVKFTPENGSIRVEIKKTENDILISVKDSGVGLSKTNMDKIFTPFFQVDSNIARKYKGTGLGLSIVKGISEAHKGKVVVESEGEGKGSTFTIILPIK